MIRQLLQSGKFDWLAYLALYPDVREAGVSSKLKGLNHWFRNGRHEKRAFPLRGDPSCLRSHPRRIIIDITNRCNLNCIDCNRLCGPGQAPAADHMHPLQIEHFIKECLHEGRRWDIIRIEGGEPSLNPWLPEIVDLMVSCKKELFPHGQLIVYSNGNATETKQILELLPVDVTKIDSQKSDLLQPDHRPITVAPCDKDIFAGHDFSVGCSLPAHFGLGLNLAGFYPHPICGAIDRVFGFDLGLKALPRDDFEDFHKTRSKLCHLCGWYLYMGINLHYDLLFGPVERKGTVSRTWKAALDHFRENPPLLSTYPSTGEPILP